MAVARTEMSRTSLALLAACLIPPPAVAQAPGGLSGSRGELLYATHCIACHSTQVHWRQRKLATDWTSLKAEVRRWAKNSGLGWSDEEVTDVARYLNATQYRFAIPAGTELGRAGPVLPVARVN